MKQSTLNALLQLPEILFNSRIHVFKMCIRDSTVLKNDSDAEDIVHDVFLRIATKYMAKISTIENETDLRNYLLKATKNAAHPTKKP